jgi:hypothetical protein
VRDADLSGRDRQLAVSRVAAEGELYLRRHASRRSAVLAARSGCRARRKKRPRPNQHLFFEILPVDPKGPSLMPVKKP